MKIDFNQLTKMAARTAESFIIMLVLIGIGYSFGRDAPLTSDDLPLIMFISAVLLFPVTFIEMIVRWVEFMDRKLDETARKKKQASIS